MNLTEILKINPDALGNLYRILIQSQINYKKAMKEKTNNEPKRVNWHEATLALLSGKHVRRKNWRPGSFLFLTIDSVVPQEKIHRDPMKKALRRFNSSEPQKQHLKNVWISAHIDKMCFDGRVIIGWSAHTEFATRTACENEYWEILPDLVEEQAEQKHETLPPNVHSAVEENDEDDGETLPPIRNTTDMDSGSATGSETGATGRAPEPKILREKVYSVRTIEYDNGTIQHEYRNSGMTPFEVLGLAEFTKYRFLRHISREELIKSEVTKEGDHFKSATDITVNKPKDSL